MALPTDKHIFCFSISAPGDVPEYTLTFGAGGDPKVLRATKVGAWSINFPIQGRYLVS